MDISAFITEFSYFAILFLMTTNGFVSFPSSQFLYIIVGYFVGTGKLTLIPALLVGAIGNVIGNIILYEITRKHGVKAALKYLPLTPSHIEQMEKYFARKGLAYLFLGKLTPALKVFVPVAAGLSKTPRGIYVALMTISSLIWAGAFIAIGYYFGASADVLKTYSKALIVVAIFVTIFAYRGFKNAQ